LLGEVHIELRISLYDLERSNRCDTAQLISLVSRAHPGPEGALMSRKPGVSSALRQAGSTYAPGKLSDDLFEEGIKAAVSHLSSGAVAASARYVGLAAGATWVCAQRGRDAYVLAFSKLNVTFKRDPAVR
jgi:hypothetical protein